MSSTATSACDVDSVVPEVTQASEHIKHFFDWITSPDTQPESLGNDEMSGIITQTTKDIQSCYGPSATGAMGKRRKASKQSLLGSVFVKDIHEWTVPELNRHRKNHLLRMLSLQICSAALLAHQSAAATQLEILPPDVNEYSAILLDAKWENGSPTLASSVFAYPNKDDPSHSYVVRTVGRDSIDTKELSAWKVDEVVSRLNFSFLTDLDLQPPPLRRETNLSSPTGSRPSVRATGSQSDSSTKGNKRAPALAGPSAGASKKPRAK